MNEPKIKVGSVWIYLGPGIGKNRSHTVTQFIDGEVATWSEPSSKQDEGGESWLGSENDFRRCFRKKS